MSQGGSLDVRFAKFTLDRKDIVQWIRKSGRAVAIYYGKFPVESARVLIVPDEGGETSGGQAFGNAGAAVRLFVGQDVSKDTLAQDWQLTREMVHLAFPNVPRSTWLTEGMAVYVEPMARVQAGDLTAEYIWGDFVKLLPMGLPKPGDQGLDKAEERDRIYEGGALFWLMADIETRKRTNNRVGVQDALRGVLELAGDIEQVRPAETVMKDADAATGQQVLSEFHQLWRTNPVKPDLDKVWSDLGVKISDGKVTFDDAAPLAAYRKAMTAARPLD